jgi:hypothetical protein
MLRQPYPEGHGPARRCRREMRLLAGGTADGTQVGQHHEPSGTVFKAGVALQVVASLTAIAKQQGRRSALSMAYLTRYIANRRHGRLSSGRAGGLQMTIDMR